MAADYTLYYWPIPFRGHFVRYVLSHLGLPHDEAPTEALVRLKSLPVADQPVPFMAPPVLHDRTADLWLAQLPAILGYLGRKHGLYPAEPGLDALTDKLIGDANDVLEELTCNCGKTMWSREGWSDFVAGRLPRWMGIFEETGRRHGLTADAGHLLGTPAPTLADLASAALWFTATDKLPPLGPLLAREAPAIAAHAGRIATLPAIAAMRAECDARWGTAYCGGLIEDSLRSMLAGRE